MISILIGGKPLYIPKDTVIVLEQHNYTLGDEEMAGDIVWTFDLPADANAKLLSGEQYMYATGHKEYDCLVRFDGIPVTQGKMYVQSSQDEKRLQCGISANAFGVGFGAKMMRENDYGPDITISDSQANHRTNWAAFLASTLQEQSPVKFMLFADEKFYKDNNGYGYFKGNPSSLMASTAEAFTKYVNRLFLDANGNIIQNAANLRQGVRVFNEANAALCNGYVFAPAIRLDWLMRQVMKSAGLKLSGDWVCNHYIHQLFSQSYNALDGDVFQYGVNTNLELSGNLNVYADVIDGCQKYHYNNRMYSSFGWAGQAINFAFRLLLPVGELQNGGEATKTIRRGVSDYGFKALRTNEIYALCVRTSSAERPSIRMSLGWYDGSGSKVYAYGKWPTDQELIDRADVESNGVIRKIQITGNGNCRIWYEGTWGALLLHSTHSFQFYTPTNSMLIQLTGSKSNNIYYSGALGGYTEGNVTPGWHPASWGANNRLYIELVKCTIGSTDGELAETSISMDEPIDAGDWGDIECITDYEVQSSLQLDTTDNPLNIFSNVLRWKEHMPDISNGEFIAAICQMFGLNMYSNPITKEVQLSFFSEIWKTQSFDITEFVVKKERLAYEPKEYSVTIGTTLGGSDVSETNIISDVDSIGDIPSAMINKAKHAFVRNEKAYRKSTQEDDSSTFRWMQAGGDNRPMIAGAADGESEDVGIDVKIPNMRWVDDGIKEKYVCEADGDGCSQLLDEDYDGKFDLVLQQYRGRRLMRMQDTGSGVGEAYIEYANPTCYNDDGSVDSNYINLSASGENSIGEKWLRPLYEFKGDCEKFRFTASMPSWAFAKLMSLLQPQDGAVIEHTRWIMVKSQRFLPTKISYELGCKERVLATIECAAKRVDF